MFSNGMGLVQLVYHHGVWSPSVCSEIQDSNSRAEEYSRGGSDVQERESQRGKCWKVRKTDAEAEGWCAREHGVFGGLLNS